MEQLPNITPDHILSTTLYDYVPTKSPFFSTVDDCKIRKRWIQTHLEIPKSTRITMMPVRTIQTWLQLSMKLDNSFVSPQSFSRMIFGHVHSFVTLLSTWPPLFAIVLRYPFVFWIYCPWIPQIWNPLGKCQSRILIRWDDRNSWILPILARSIASYLDLFLRDVSSPLCQNNTPWNAPSA